MKFNNIDVNSNKLDHIDIFGRNFKVVFLRIAISEIENIATIREARFQKRCKCIGVELVTQLEDFLTRCGHHEIHCLLQWHFS